MAAGGADAAQRVRPDPPRDDPAPALVALRSRGRLDFTTSRRASVSAIVTAAPEPAHTVLALAALRAELPDTAEALLLSTAPSPAITAIAVGLKVMPGTDRRDAIAAATAPLLLFVDARCEPLPGAIAAGLRRLAADGCCGALGGPTLDGAGRLVEAGLALSGDGDIAACLAGADGASAAANFVRHPDACTTSLLFVRREPAVAIGGFTAGFQPGAAADADLCLGIWQAGWRVVYDPAVAVRDRGAGDLPVITADERAMLAARHPAYLALRPRSPTMIRAPLLPSERVLVIAPALPATDDSISALAAGGAAVTIFPLDGGPPDPAWLPAGLPDTVEIICGPGADGLDVYLERAGDEFTRIEHRERA